MLLANSTVLLFVKLQIFVIAALEKQCFSPIQRFYSLLLLYYVTTSQSVAYVTVTISLIKSIAVKVDDQISG